MFNVIHNLPINLQDGVSVQLLFSWHNITASPRSMYPSLHVTSTTDPYLVSEEFTSPFIGVGSPQSKDNEYLRLRF